MSLELLRNRWTYPVLVSLKDGPLRTAQLLGHINEGTARNADLVGDRALHEKVLLTTLRQMQDEGLLLLRRAEADPGTRELTLAGTELLHSLHPVGVWATAHHDQLATALRRHRGHPQPPSGRPALGPEQEYWRGVGMMLRVLCLRWTFPLLCQISHGPQHPTGIAEAVNAGVARSDLTERLLSEKMFWDTLHRLIDVGLVLHQPRPEGQFASTARCTLMPAGHALLAALVPLSDWAASHEDQLLGIVRRRQGLSG